MATSKPNSIVGVKRSDPDPGVVVNMSRSETVGEIEELQYDTPRGWACVVGVFLIAVHTWGMSSAYGVFLTYYATYPSFQPTSNVMFAYVGGLSIAVAFITSPLVGYYVSKGYSRPILFTGVLIEAGSYVGASFATRSWHLFLTQGFGYGLGMGMLYTGSVGIISQWFRRHTGFANALGAAGTGVGGLAYSLGTNRMLENLGYAMTMRVLAILIFCFNGIAVLLLRNRNEQIGVIARSPFNYRLLTTPGYPLILVYGLCCLFGYIMGLFSMSSYCTSIGLTASQGSVAVAMMSVGQAIGRPAIGFLCDNLGILNVTTGAAAFSTILNFVMWPLAKSYSVILVYGLLAGTVTGTFYAEVAPLTAQVVGLRELDRALSLIWLVLVIPALFRNFRLNTRYMRGSGTFSSSLPVAPFSVGSTPESGGSNLSIASQLQTVTDRAMAQPKNILLLVADDLGREQMGCYGCKAIKTPHLDALSASGTQFDMAFTSTASCSGSRTVIYTGLHTHETGSYGLNHERNGFQTFANIETAPEAFNKIGYKTGILGKIHVGPDDRYPWQVREESDSRNVAYIADRASAFFRGAQDESKPFFLTVGFVDPHRHIPHRGGFGNVEGNHDPRLKDHVYKPEDVEVPSFLSDIPEVRQELAEYYRAITRMDQGVGLILAALDAAGQRDNTLVLFLSDNGPPFINSKTTLFEAGVRLPFLLRAPGISAPGSINPNLVSYVDILPTFLDWAGHGGANAPEGKIQRRGRSILSVLSKDSQDEAWGQVFGSHTFHEITNYWPTRFMRNRRFKYHRNVCWKLDFPMAMDLYASLSFEGMRNSSPPMIGKRKFRDYIQRPPEELYDLEKDPLELENLAGRPEFQDTLKEMRKALEEWQLETRDLWLWRDGTAVVLYTADRYNYAREGLRIPDRFDQDAENPGTQNVEFFPLKE